MLLRTGQAAARLGISVDRVRQLVHLGELEGTTTPLGRLFAEEDVDELADARRRRRAAVPLQFVGVGAPGAA